MSVDLPPGAAVLLMLDAEGRLVVRSGDQKLSAEVAFVIDMAHPVHVAVIRALERGNGRALTDLTRPL